MSSVADTPTVSVIIATYRRPQLLPRAIRSVLAQTFTDFEVIVVDDASGDATPEVVASFTDPRLRYLCLERNGGVNRARNTAAAQARGELLAMVDDDDRVEPTFLADLIALLAQSPPTVGFVWSWKTIVELSADGERLVQQLTYRIATPAPVAGARLRERPIGGSGGLMVRRCVFEETGGFDPAFFSGGDTDLILRMAARYDFAVLPKPLYVITKLEGPQITGFSEKKGRSIELLLDRHGPIISPVTRHRWVVAAARNYFAVGNRAEGRRVMARLVRQSPWKVRDWLIWGAFELAPRLPAPLRQRIYRSHR